MMGLFGPNKNDIKEMSKDPEKAMDYADKTLNKGIMGGMTKAFMGKDFVNDMNQTMEKGREAMEKAKDYQDVSKNGLPATAQVISIQDTGTTINDNPVVVLQLKVQPQYEAPFDAVSQTVVSRIAIPRAGDTINIKYSAADHNSIAVV